MRSYHQKFVQVVFELNSCDDKNFFEDEALLDPKCWRYDSVKERLMYYHLTLQ